MIPLSEVPGLAGEDLVDADIILAKDFEKLNLYKPDGDKDYGGRKSATRYFVRKGGIEAVRFDHKDVKFAGNDLDGNPTYEVVSTLDEATDIQTTACILNYDGSIFDSRVYYKPIRNHIKLELSRIYSAFVFLQKTGREHPDSGFRALINYLLDYYSKEIQVWLTGNSESFLNAMKNEPAIILNKYFRSSEAPTAFDPNKSLTDDPTHNPENIPNTPYVLLHKPVNAAGKIVQDAIEEQILAKKWIASNS